MRRLLVVLASTLLLAACATVVTPTRAEPSAVPSAIPTPSAPAFLTGLTVPWAVGGERIRADGTRGVDPGQWPPFPVPAVRLWDTRTAWLHLQPAPGRWHWATLDALLAKAQHEGTRDVMLVLAGTPKWAAVRTLRSDAPWLGRGSASPPSSLSDWTDFVHTVATRYRERITAYEIGNEPNLLTFWNGTPTQYGEFVAAAASAIRDADPSATIVANVGLVRRDADLDDIATWLAPVTASADVDAVSLHAYPKAGRLDEVVNLLRAARGRLAVLTDLPAWMTEVNVADGARLPHARQAGAVTDLTQDVYASGFERAYWYAWNDLAMDTLIPLYDGTPGGEALAQAVTSPVP